MLFKLASCQLLVWVFVVVGPVNLPVLLVLGMWLWFMVHDTAAVNIPVTLPSVAYIDLMAC
jgi:hypothetical protein